MFCPLCQSEYRQGFTRCADCDVDLVWTLGPENSQAEGMTAPPTSLQELWKGNDHILFDAITDQLRRANLPFQITREKTPEVKERKPLTRAAVGIMADGLMERFVVFVNSQDLGTARQLAADFLGEQPYLFCPMCKAEIFIGFAECEDCQSPLVSSLDQVPNDPPVMVWHGFEEDTWEDLAQGLLQGGIPCHAFELAPRLEYRSSNPPREFVLRVPRSSFVRAQQVLAGQDNPEAEEPPEDIEATVEVRSGMYYETDFSALDNALEMAGIISVILRDARGREFLLVAPNDESRAREILCEITEGTPPA
jgi:hypothetical protein